MNLILWIFIIGLIALFMFAFLSNIRKRQMMNAPTCGHSGVKRYVPEERAWLCDECYNEWIMKCNEDKYCFGHFDKDSPECNCCDVEVECYESKIGGNGLTPQH